VLDKLEGGLAISYGINTIAFTRKAIAQDHREICGIFDNENAFTHETNLASGGTEHFHAR
jgi:hypothetical protein